MLDSPEAKRLLTVPGVNVIAAATFLAAVGDIKRFRDSRKLVAYLGLDPGSGNRASSPPARAGSQSAAQLGAVGARRGRLDGRPAARAAARLLPADQGPARARQGDRRHRPQARCPVLVPALPRRGLRPPAAVANRPEAPAARGRRRRADPQGQAIGHVGHPRADAPGRETARRAGAGLLRAHHPRLAGRGADEAGASRDSGTRIEQGPRRASRAAGRSSSKRLLFDTSSAHAHQQPKGSRLNY